jgi:hypothetical protein
LRCCNDICTFFLLSFLKPLPQVLQSEYPPIANSLHPFSFISVHGGPIPRQAIFPRICSNSLRGTATSAI